jgi:hypothetical protein
MDPKKLEQHNGIFPGEFKSPDYFSQDPKVKEKRQKQMQERMDAFIHDLEGNEKKDNK